jgi:glycosyltransferase A (GT-A) superfamily protein (DUF2064 family)
MTNKSALGIFFRIPAPNKVKKRLAAEIGEKEARKAYEYMLYETIKNVSRLRGIDLYGFYEGEKTSLNPSSSSGNPPSPPFLHPCGFAEAKEKGGKVGFEKGLDFELIEKLPLYSQKGVDLGERMCNAVKWLFHKGYEKVSLIGADSPDLPLSNITEAFEKLDAYDMVIGPSEDGGYYLIGMNKPHEVIFEGIQWGHETVLRDSICRAKAAGVSYFLLPQWYDIDDLDGLNRWRLKNLTHSDNGL